MLDFPNRLRQLIKLKKTLLQDGKVNSVQLALVRLKVLK